MNARRIVGFVACVVVAVSGVLAEEQVDGEDRR